VVLHPGTFGPEHGSRRADDQERCAAESGGRIELRSTEWDEQVLIRVRHNGKEFVGQTMRRQTLEQLEARLSQFPKRDDCTQWFRKGIKVDRSIGICNWHTHDIMEIRTHTGQETPLAAHFRHDSHPMRDFDGLRIEQVAQQRVDVTWAFRIRHSRYTRMEIPHSIRQ
jgi:hypothetical protein